MNQTQSTLIARTAETQPENEAIEETVNIPDEDPKESEYSILKFEDAKIDKNKYKIKHPMKHTIAADLLIKTEFSSETWLIPVHKKVISAKIPYFGAMFRRNSSDGEKLMNIGATDCVLAPDHISAKIVFAYVASKYLLIENPEADIGLILGDDEKWAEANLNHVISITDSRCPNSMDFADVDVVMELFDLAVFWNDETMETKLVKWIDFLLLDDCVMLNSHERLRLISIIYDHPQLHEILKTTVLKHCEKLESATKSFENLIIIE